MSLEAEAMVVGLRGPDAMITVQAKPGGCGRCHEPGGCGTSMLTQLGSSSERTYRVTNSINALVGDRVIVTLPDGSLWRAAFTAYLLPLAAGLLGAALGTLAGGDTLAMLGCGLGLLLGMAWLRLGGDRQERKLLSMRFAGAPDCVLHTSGAVDAR